MGGKRKSSLVVTEKDSEIAKTQASLEESKSLKKPQRIEQGQSTKKRALKDVTAINPKNMTSLSDSDGDKVQNDEYWDYQAMALPGVDGDDGEQFKQWRKIQKLLDESKEKSSAKVFLMSVPKGFNTDNLNTIQMDQNGGATKLDIGK